MKGLIFLALSFSVITIVAGIHLQAGGINLHTGGNSWALDTAGKVSEKYYFSSLPAKFSTYFYTEQKSKQFTLSIQMNSSVATNIMTTIGLISNKITIPANSKYKIVELGKFKAVFGYNNIIVELMGLNSGSGSVKNFIISDLLAKLQYVPYLPTKTEQNLIKGRKGTTVGFTPIINNKDNIEYYYNEAIVPVNYDIAGSNFMINGFKEGQFGLKVNSKSERGIYFSVFSSYETDNPSLIPNEDKLILVSKVDGGISKQITSKKFGKYQKISGIQVFLLFNWKASVPYKFLIKAKPIKNKGTQFTAWIYSQFTTRLNAGWIMIAKIIRPKIQTYLTGMYSFVECINPNYGNQTRMVSFENQWYYNQKNKWTQVNQIIVALQKSDVQYMRRDFSVELSNINRFQVKNGGFFNTTSISETKLSRPLSSMKLNLNLAKFA